MAQEYTPLKDIPHIRDTLRATFKTGATKPLAWRRHQLLQLARMMQEHAEALADAIGADLGRPRMEAYMAEVCVILDRAMTCAARLEEWARPEAVVDVPEWQRAWTPTVRKVPKGTVLIIAPWNYPLILSLQPLYGAIAAGCCAVIKTSEYAPHYANLLARLLPQYVDPSAYRVVRGEVAEVTRLLELQWDHIFYTGNGRIARVISAAAAKHLTPVTLELGGKSPVIIDGTFDMRLAAKRILWAKSNNSGQMCVIPDYILVPRALQDTLIAAFKEHYAAFWPDGPLRSKSYSRIVNALHFDRLRDLLGRTRGAVVLGGGVEREGFGMEPTVVRDVRDGDSLLEQEIFGPILPLVPVDSLQEAVDFVAARNHPLVLYAFTEDPATKEYIIENTTSGNLAFNDCVQQLTVSELPFGGVGESGHGRQVLKYSYELFTYIRATADIPKSAEPTLEARYAPYTAAQLEFFSEPLRRSIPASSPTGLVKDGVNGHGRRINGML